MVAMSKPRERAQRLNMMTTLAPRRAAILVARAAFTGAASREIRVLAQELTGHMGVDRMRIAFTEQGSPPLREVVHELVAEQVDELLLLPLMLPVEPEHRLWLLRSIKRWRRADTGRRWPQVRIGPPPSECANLLALARDMLAAALAGGELIDDVVEPPEGSQVPRQKRRALVCLGGPCNNAGGALLWGHLRNAQKRLALASAGGGVVSAKTSCLGPCARAPVVQIYPEATVYGGVDEAGIDRIVIEHLIGGRVVQALAYAPSRARQRLRESG